MGFFFTEEPRSHLGAGGSIATGGTIVTSGSLSKKGQVNNMFWAPCKCMSVHIQTEQSLLPHGQPLQGLQPIQELQQVRGLHAHQRLLEVPVFQAHPEEETVKDQCGSLQSGSKVCARGDDSQQVQADHRNHAHHAVRGDLRYHAVQQYLEVQRYQQRPEQDATAGSQQ